MRIKGLSILLLVFLTACSAQEELEIEEVPVEETENEEEALERLQAE